MKNKKLKILIVDFGGSVFVRQNLKSLIPNSKGFAAPEQINGIRTFSSDIFSVGKVALEMTRLTRRIRENEISEQFQQILNEMCNETEHEKRPTCEQAIQRLEKLSLK